jgi:uncharacterized protein YacL
VVTKDRQRRPVVIEELFRLAIVIAFVAAGYSLSPWLSDLLPGRDPDGVRLLAVVLGALFGYVLGGVMGRVAIAGVDSAQRRLATVESVVLVSGAAGAVLAGLIVAVVLFPLSLLPGRHITLPIGTGVGIIAIYMGTRVGMARGADLSRFVGVRGRLDVKSPSRGAGTKLLDSSALIDGRLVEIARCGFLEGTLVVTEFILQELQSLADSSDDQKRTVGRRGLDTIRTLQDDGAVLVEYSDEDPADVATVDGKLAALARKRNATLITTDGALAQVAEVSGVRVLNVHALAEAVRPPATPGDRLTVRMVKEGTEAGQGVGYLEDGTMVVVEDAVVLIGQEVEVDVTSIVTNRRGRMLFGVTPEARS